MKIIDTEDFIIRIADHIDRATILMRGNTHAIYFTGLEFMALEKILARFTGEHLNKAIEAAYTCAARKIGPVPADLPPPEYTITY